MSSQKNVQSGKHLVKKMSGRRKCLVEKMFVTEMSGRGNVQKLDCKTILAAFIRHIVSLHFEKHVIEPGRLTRPYNYIIK